MCAGLIVWFLHPQRDIIDYVMTGPLLNETLFNVTRVFNETLK